MTERPIIFTGESVRAILAGKKSQTRRNVKPQPEFSDPWWEVRGRLTVGGSPCSEFKTNRDAEVAAALSSLPCPFGAPGDRLWVRETWDVFALPDEVPSIAYAADSTAIPIIGGEGWKLQRADNAHCWRPSIYMPRWASRLTLEVTEVRVQRLQEISEDDACAEGVLPCGQGSHPTELSPYRCNFAQAWNSINRKRAPWESNPWCWAISFRRVE